MDKQRSTITRSFQETNIQQLWHRRIGGSLEDLDRVISLAMLGRIISSFLTRRNWGLMSAVFPL